MLRHTACRSEEFTVLYLTPHLSPSAVWSTAVCCQGVVQTVSLSAVQDVKPELQPISQLWRFTLNPQSAHMEGHPLSQRAMEYPSVNPDLSGELSASFLAAVCHPCQLSINRADLTEGHEQASVCHMRQLSMS